MKMPTARMYGYHQPWRIEEVPVPEIGADEVLVKVAAAGMCRSDFQLADGYFKDAVPQDFPITPGHEIAGHVARVGASVPGSTGPSEGDLVLVDPSWGDGTCRWCQEGNEAVRLLAPAAGRRRTVIALRCWVRRHCAGRPAGVAARAVSLGACLSRCGRACSDGWAAGGKWRELAVAGGRSRGDGECAQPGVDELARRGGRRR
jgi:threonine dehydrogenase-like Zn-dependent dehydrogenase